MIIIIDNPHPCFTSMVYGKTIWNLHSTQPWPGPAGCLPATRAECLDGAGEGESGRAAAASLGAGWQWMGRMGVGWAASPTIDPLIHWASPEKKHHFRSILYG